ncbi:hypothetical protein J6590_015685 [Homalodisca vitripennis]|nr:hypothetical protein J6590_015685 [Homalodisca vitripennis]
MKINCERLVLESTKTCPYRSTLGLNLSDSLKWTVLIKGHQTLVTIDFIIHVSLHSAEDFIRTINQLDESDIDVSEDEGQDIVRDIPNNPVPVFDFGNVSDDTDEDPDYVPKMHSDNTEDSDDSVDQP